MAPTRSNFTPRLPPRRHEPHRQSWTALVVAGLAVVSFVLFGAMDLDGLVLALLAPVPASALGTNISDPDADRRHTRTHESLLPVCVTRIVPRAGTAPAVSTHRHRVQVVRPWHLPAPHSGPTSADPL